MLNRRILRIKVFKELFSYAGNRGMTLKEVLSEFDTSCEAARDLYLFMLQIIPALSKEALDRIEAARGKINPTEAELNPDMRFAENGVAALLQEDPDFQKLVSRKKLSWEPYDALLRHVCDSIFSKDYFAAYMASPERSLARDTELWIRIFEEEFADNDELAGILEDMSIYWNDDLAYSLTYCCRSMEHIARTGRWEFPPLYQSEILRKRGRDAEDDKDFAVRLLKCAYGRFEEYHAMAAEAVSRWDRDRLVTADVILIVLGLAEAENFPNIPVKVTINEYVDISKFYSTPKSSSFVNATLDNLIRRMSDEGRIEKR